MAKQIHFEGTTYSVPDDATDDEITEIAGGGVKPQPQAGNVSAPAPTPQQGLISKMQSILGDKPIALNPSMAAIKSDSPFWTSLAEPAWGTATASGLQSVVQGVKGAVAGMYNTVRHPIDTVQGLASLPSQAAQVPGAISDINQSPDPLGTYAKVGQETAGQGAGQALTALAGIGIGKGINAIPRASRAAAVLQRIRGSAANVPVDTTPIQSAANEILTQSERGASMPSPVSKLLDRLSNPGKGPFNYPEAKDFQSNISNLSANEKMSLNSNQLRQVGDLNQALKSSLTKAAGTVGEGDNFVKAMSEYHRAMKLRGYSDAVIARGWKGAVAGLAGTGVAYGTAKVLGLDKLVGGR